MLPLTLLATAFRRLPRTTILHRGVSSHCSCRCLRRRQEFRRHALPWCQLRPVQIFGHLAGLEEDVRERDVINVAHVPVSCKLGVNVEEDGQVYTLTRPEALLLKAEALDLVEEPAYLNTLAWLEQLLQTQSRTRKQPADNRHAP